MEKFELQSVTNMTDHQLLNNIMSMDFYFKNTRFKQDPCSVIFAMRDKIVEFNF